MFTYSISEIQAAEKEGTNKLVVSEQEVDKNNEDSSEVRSIFIWQLPDTPTTQASEATDADISEYQDEDDTAADEPYSDAETANEEYSEEDISLQPNDSETLKGYLEYSEGAEDIYLKDDNNEFVLNLQVPQKFETWSATNSISIPQTSFSKNVYARSGDITYNISPFVSTTSIKEGNFSFGTSYNESIDTSDLGFTTSFFTKYDKKHFSISSSYDKNAGVSYSRVIDKFSITPELKFNDHLSLKNVLTSDITRNRKQNSVILSIKPTKDDRLRFEFGAGQTFDENREMIKTELKFQTQFKW